MPTYNLFDGREGSFSVAIAISKSQQKAEAKAPLDAMVRAACYLSFGRVAVRLGPNNGRGVVAQEFRDFFATKRWGMTIVQHSVTKHSLPPLPPPIKRASGDTSAPVICQQVFDSVTVHANGDIVCWCVDSEGKRVYGNVFKDRIDDIFNGPAYEEIRNWMLNSRPGSWCPAIDTHCPVRIMPAHEHIVAGPRKIKLLKLEPVTYCNLKCPACPVETGFKSIPHLSETRAQRLLPLATMLDVVAQLPDLEVIEYFDLGEPFIHRDTIAFLREVRRTRPGTKIVTSTNGTVLTPIQIKALAEDALMDRIIFSIDGATQESYGKYRVGGSFDKAFAKMKALLEACRAAGTWKKYPDSPHGVVQIVWQYILFHWNDTDKEIQLAKDLARSVDVPLQWIITTGREASKRFLHGSTDAMSLMNPPDSFIYGWHAEHRLKRAEKEIPISCDLISLPYGGRSGLYSRLWKRPLGYCARFTGGTSGISSEASSVVVFDVDLKNRTGHAWDTSDRNALRIGVLLKSETGETIRELSGALLPKEVARPGGQTKISVPVTLPERPGEYKLLIDIVHEFVCWFSDRGSPALTVALNVI